MTVPWNNTFDNTPVVGSSSGLGFDDIVDLKKAVRERLGAEHRFDLADQATQGEHAPGSAICFVQATAPAARANGTTLSTDDAGVLWFDTTDLVLKVWNGTAWVTVTNTGTFESPDTNPIDVEGVSFLNGVLTISGTVSIAVDAATLPDLTVGGTITASGVVSTPDRLEAKHLRLTVGGAPASPANGDIWIV